MSNIQQEAATVNRREVIKYIVNGEEIEHEFEKPPERRRFSLTVREILESAEFAPVEEWELTRDQDNHTFESPDDDVTLVNGEQFTATFKGVAPVS